MLKNTTVLAPYFSKGKKITQSSHHDELFIIDIVGTNKFYTITSSKELMLKNNPPDQVPKTKGKKDFTMVVADFSGTEASIINDLNSGKIRSSKSNKSNSPKGLADIR